MKTMKSTTAKLILSLREFRKMNHFHGLPRESTATIHRNVRSMRAESPIPNYRAYTKMMIATTLMLPPTEYAFRD